MSRRKSRMSMDLGLAGDLPPAEEVTQLLGVAPTQKWRQDNLNALGQPQLVDVWSLDLIEWENDPPLPEATAHAAEVLWHLTPGLAQLDRSVVRAVLCISTIRKEATGGFAIPTRIVAAAGVAQLEISVSVLILLEDGEKGDNHTAVNPET